MSRSKRFDYDSLTGDQLRIALAKLLIGPTDVEVALEEALDAAIDEAHTAFGLSDATGGESGNGGVTAAPAKSPRKITAAAAPKPASKSVKRAGSGSNLTAGQLASRQLQGRYLGSIRRVPAARRSRYQKIAQDVVNGGRAAAIAAIERDYPPKG